jgi:hypothetical protein
VRPRLRHRARGARAIGGGRLHDLGDADVGWLQLQQQEQTLEDRHLQPVLAQIEPPGIALLAHDRAGAPIIQQRLVELAEVDLEIEPVGRLLDQQALHVVAGKPYEVGLGEQRCGTFDELGPGCIARRLIQFDEIGRVTVGAEGLAVFQETEHALPVLLMAPGGQTVERAAPCLAISAALGEQGHEPCPESLAADRNEALAAGRKRRGDLRRGNLGLLGCLGARRGRLRSVEQLHGEGA